MDHVEVHRGITIERHPVLGRVVVATADYNLGEIVLEEKPVLVWTTGRWDEYIQKFLQLSEGKRASILDMFHPCLDSVAPLVALARPQAQLLAGLFPDLGVDLIHKLIAISNTNAHDYIGRIDAYSEYIITARQPPKRSALFDLGSKVAHSCLPNVVNSTKNAGGQLHFKAIRPIKAGDRLSMSYIGGIWTSPTSERQAKLRDSKDFLCQCERCVASDDCQVLKCPKVCGGFARLASPSDNVEDQWLCGKCGVLANADMTPVRATIASLADKLSRAETASKGGALHKYPPSTLQKLVDEIVDSLGPTHYLVVRALQFMAMICASHAAATEEAMQHFGQSRSIFGTPAELRVLSAKAGLRAAQVIECICACCVTGASCNDNHPAVYECASSDVFYAGMDLVQASSINADYACIKMVGKYLPSMRICFGEEDEDVKKLENFVKAGGKIIVRAPANQLLNGCKVFLHSLASGVEHNGKTGLVLEYLAEKQRYAVNVAGKTMSLRAANLFQIGRVQYQGREVTITGLRNQKICVSTHDNATHECVLESLVLSNGFRVRLHSLAKEEYNSQIVEIVSFAADTGRYHVRMESEKMFSVLPSKISLCL